MNRRDFLKTLLASAALTNTIVAAAGSLIEIKPERLSYVSGYDDIYNVTWFRVSYKMPDGREWHDLFKRSGDYTSKEGMEIMWKEHEHVLNIALTNRYHS